MGGDSPVQGQYDENPIKSKNLQSNQPRKNIIPRLQHVQYDHVPSVVQCVSAQEIDVPKICPRLQKSSLFFGTPPLQNYEAGVPEKFEEMVSLYRLLSRHYEKTNEKDAQKMKQCQKWVVR